MKMRAISLINHLEFDFNGSVVRKGVTLGDVDNDGDYELIVGNETGEVAIFKGLERWYTLANLGFVSCVIVGDILNRGKNCLVIVTADGWCYIYDSVPIINEEKSLGSQDVDNTEEGIEQVDGQAFSGEGPGTPKSDSLSDEPKEPEKTSYMKRIHAQRIPPNTKDILLGDIDGDGLIEMVLGLTDRVVRSYRWVETSKDVILAEIKDGENLDGSVEFYPGKLVALNKWECAKQIGSISLHHTLEGIPTLLVAQPGGTFMRIRHQPDETSQPQENIELSDSSSSPSENWTGSLVDYQFLGISRMRNQNISTEILGDFKTAADPSSPLDCSHSDKSSNKSNSSKIDVDNKGGSNEKYNGGDNKGVPYAVATLDGTIILVQDEVILWAMAVDHQVFALTKLDVTGNGIDEIVVCSWDGHTYILDLQKNVIRFQLNESVQAFDSGYYTLIPGNTPVTCFVYITFRNKILLYFDIPLKNMVCKKFEPDLTKLSGVFEAKDDDEKRSLCNNMEETTKKRLVEYLLYGVKFDELME